MKYFLTKSTFYLKPFLLKNGIKISQIVSSKYLCGERTYKLTEEVAGQEATLIAAVLSEPESFFELLAAVELLKTNGVKKLWLKIPYLAYARQDRPNARGEGALGVLVAELLKNHGGNSLYVLEPHGLLITKALGKNNRVIDAASLFAGYFKNQQIQMVVAPDKGALERAKKLAKLLPRAEIGFIEKIRLRPGLVVARKLHGQVKNKNILLFDDMIDSGGTIIQAVKLLKKNNAATIRVAAVHGIFSKSAHRCLAQLPVEEIVVTNSLPQTKYKKIKILDMTPFFCLDYRNF